jgi:hypothetical protein
MPHRYSRARAVAIELRHNPVNRSSPAYPGSKARYVPLGGAQRADW